MPSGLSMLITQIAIDKGEVIMNGIRNGCLLCCCLLLSFIGGCSHSNEIKTNQIQTAPNKPQNPAFAEIADDPNLPRVLLIGDSISMGYTVGVRELLKGTANVHRIPENGGPTTRGLINIEQWLGKGNWDVIHFNWGLHDLKFMKDGKRQIPLDEYRTNLDCLTQRLSATGATLIWANTTPVPEGGVSPKRLPEDVALYNKAALEIMNKYGIAVDDLYSFAQPILPQIQMPVNVHFTEIGSDALAHCVASRIKLALIQRDIKRAAIEKISP